MGGGDSKQKENEDNPPKVETPKNGSKNNSKFPSPRINNKESIFKENKKSDGKNHYNPGQLQNNQIQNMSQNQNQLGSQSLDNINPEYFAGWPEKFQKDDSVSLKILIIVIEPTLQIKNLKKQCSEHYAKLTWQYEYIKNGKRKQTFLRFFLNQDGGFNLSFLLNEEASCHEGDQTIWNMICPFRTNDQSQKVGGFTCERSYQSNQNNYEGGNEEHQLDEQIFYKWEEKPSVSRASMRRLLDKKRMIEDLKNQKGFQYSETTKYFNSNDQWTFSVLIEEKFNTFKSWVVELDPQGDQKQKQKIKTMSTTLKNDIQTRQSMYIDEMKKKRDILKESRNSVR